MRTEYLTLSGPGESEYVEKKSRFIGMAAPAASEAEALAFIAGVRGRRGDASHNVFAYAVGEGVPVKRYSDAGEPQGTAGIPALDVIEKSGLSDTVIVVTRYFGGILLGAAGLIRSYGKAASTAVEAAGIVKLSLARELNVLVGYPLLGAVRNETEKRGYTITEITYGVDAELRVTVPHAEADMYAVGIAELTAGEAIVGLYGDTYEKKPYLRAIK